MTGDKLDRIEAKYEGWRQDVRDDVLALVKIARAAREAVVSADVVLPAPDSEQSTVLALIEEWQEAAGAIETLAAALAVLDGAR